MTCEDGNRHYWKDGWICEKCGLRRADFIPDHLSGNGLIMDNLSGKWRYKIRQGDIEITSEPIYRSERECRREAKKALKERMMESAPPARGE